MRVDPKIPEPLKRSAPRQVRPTAAGYALIAGVVGLLIAAAAVGAWVANRALDDKRWTAEVIRAEGEIGELRKTRDKDRRVVASFRYDAGGIRRTAATKLRRRDEARFQVGSRVPIRYSAVQPERAWIEGYGPNITPIWLAMALPAGLVAPALALWIYYRRQARLLAEGRPAIATVIEAKKPYLGAENWRVRYEFTALDGSRRTGRYHVEKKPPEVGSRMVVVYDRDNPKRSVRYPALLTRLA